MILKNFLITLVMVLSVITIANAHSVILVDLDLDFDPDLKNGVINTAQTELGITQGQDHFELERRLIKVVFESKNTQYVWVDPLDFSVYGFKNYNLREHTKDISTTAEERKQTAQEIFDSIPDRYKGELQYDGEVENRYYDGVFVHTWNRYVDGIQVFREFLEVEVDGSNGEVVSWHLTLFNTNEEYINTNPAILIDTVQKMAEIKFDAEPIDFEPVLIVIEDNPVWITKVKRLYPFFVGIDALEGEVLLSGSLDGKLSPDQVDITTVEVIENDFIKERYSSISFWNKLLGAIGLVDMNTIKAESILDYYDNRYKDAEPTGEIIDGVRVINLTALQFQWDPEFLVVNYGEDVRIHVTSVDVEHGFEIEGFYIEGYDVDTKVQPGETMTVEFNANEVGEWDIVCTVYCGTGHGEMKGKFVIKG